MKARILFVALCVAFTSFATAQEAKKCNGPTPEQRIEWRVMNLQQKLLLDDAKSAEFAQIYKEYLQAKMNCRPTCVRGKNLTDDQIKTNLESVFATKQKALDLDKELYTKLSGILNAKQLEIVFAKEKFDGRGKWGKPGMKAPFAPGAKKGMMKAGCKKECKKAECPKTDCKKECKKAECPKADCKKECKKAECPKTDCKKECKKAECPKADCKKECKKAECPKVDCKKECKKAECPKADCKKECKK